MVETTPPAHLTRPDLLGQPRERLSEQILPLVKQRYRVQQVYDALHRRAVADFEEMTELAKSLRGALAERFSHLLGPRTATGCLGPSGYQTSSGIPWTTCAR